MDSAQVRISITAAEVQRDNIEHLIDLLDGRKPMSQWKTNDGLLFKQHADTHVRTLQALYQRKKAGD